MKGMSAMRHVFSGLNKTKDIFVIAVVVAVVALWQPARVLCDMKCPEDMVKVSPGEFLMGWDNGEPDERPEHMAFTDGYCIDKFEYPNKQGEMPLEGSNYEEAVALCAEQGKRLCTEAEWERACRGKTGTIYTSTMQHGKIAEQCRLAKNGAVPSGSNMECSNDYGVFDMTGNLWEWAEGEYDAETPWPLVKGGSYQKGALFAACYARFTQHPEENEKGMGFRCCKDVEMHPAFAAEYAPECKQGRPHEPHYMKFLQLKREPGLTHVFYQDYMQDGAPEADILFITKEKAQRLHLTVQDGKLAEAATDLDREQAVALFGTFKNTMLEEGGLGFQNCWGCDGGCGSYYMIEEMLSDEDGRVIGTMTEQAMFMYDKDYRLPWPE